MDTKKFKNEAERNKILDRIKKILALANGTNYEGEASTAMKMAQSYMSQYGLSMSDVELSDMLAEEIVKEKVDRDIAPEDWEEYICSAVAGIFDCRAIKGWTDRSTRNLQFVGYKSDVQMAKMVFMALRIATNSAARKAFPQDRRARKSFRLGCAVRILERAKEEKVVARKEPTGRYELVVVAKADKVQDWLDKMLGALKEQRNNRRKDIDPDAFKAGKAQGDRMDLMNKEKVEANQALQLGHSK